MAEYEGNGDFNYSGDGSSDFKRRDNNATTSNKSDDETEENVQLPEKVNEYIRELLNEKMNLDHKYPHAEKLLDAGWFLHSIQKHQIFAHLKVYVMRIVKNTHTHVSVAFR